MGFLSDVWHGATHIVTAPINAITGIVGDITSGKDVTDSVKRNLANYTASTYTSGIGVATDNSAVQKALNSAAPLTLGVSKDFNLLGADARQVNSGDGLSSGESTDFWKTSGKDSAIIGTAVFTAGAAEGLGTAGQASLAYGSSGVTKSLLGGDVKGALLSAEHGVSGAGGFGDYGDSVDSLTNGFFGSKAPSGPSKVTSGGYSSNLSGYGAAGSKSTLVVPIAIGVGAFLIYKMRHRKK